jgi:hypothetical protein
LERAVHFEPFVTYGAHQLFGKYEFEKEKGANASFQKFVDVSNGGKHSMCFAHFIDFRPGDADYL